MSKKGWIVVDRQVSREASRGGNGERYLGPNWWRHTIDAAGTFDSRKLAEDRLVGFVNSDCGIDAADFAKPGRLVVRRVVPAGTKRARAAAKAASSGREDSHSREDLGFSVIPTAELLHGEATGSYSSCVPWEKIDEYATWLEERIGKGWREPSDAYDAGVRWIAKEAIAAWRKRRAK